MKKLNSYRLILKTLKDSKSIVCGPKQNDKLMVRHTVQRYGSELERNRNIKIFLF